MVYLIELALVFGVYWLASNITITPLAVAIAFLAGTLVGRVRESLENTFGKK